MPTNKERRETERRRLQDQLETRRAREASRKRATLIASIVGTLVVIVVVVVVVVLTVSGGSSGTKQAAHEPAATTTPTPSSSVAAPPVVPTPTAPCAAPPKSTTATFRGLTVKGAKDLQHPPRVSGKSTSAPTSVLCQDLVVGTGKAASTSSQVNVQYVGLVYQTGKVFQSSWTMSQVPPFGLAPGSVIDGFSQGIGGAGKVAPMHVGGRRIIVMPAAAAYGANPPPGSGIPADAALVFVVDLQNVS